MDELTDLEMLKLCAEAMGLKLLPAYRRGTILYDKGQHDWNGLMYSKDRDGEFLFVDNGAYNPLLIDKQAFALLNKFGLGMNRNGEHWEAVWFDDDSDDEIRIEADGLHRAIVECVAAMRLRSTSTATRD
jgi:hypothetical protein